MRKISESFFSRDNNALSIGIDFQNFLERSQTIHSWHVDVKHHDVWSFFLCHLDSLKTVGCDGNHLHIRDHR